MKDSDNSSKGNDKIATLDKEWQKKERHFKIYGATKEKFNSLLKVSLFWLILTVVNPFTSSIPIMQYINVGFIVLGVSALIYQYIKLQKFAEEEKEYENTRKDLLTQIK